MHTHTHTHTETQTVTLCQCTHTHAIITETSKVSSCLQNRKSITWVAPATHSMRDSGHKKMIWMAKGSSSWLSVERFGFSNILAVFNLYKIWRETENRREKHVQKHRLCSWSVNNVAHWSNKQSLKITIPPPPPTSSHFLNYNIKTHWW